MARAASAARRASREAIARTSHSSLSCMAGITRSSPIRAVPSTPQTIGVTSTLLRDHFRCAGVPPTSSPQRFVMPASIPNRSRARPRVWSIISSMLRSSA